MTIQEGIERSAKILAKVPKGLTNVQQMKIREIQKRTARVINAINKGSIPKRIALKALLKLLRERRRVLDMVSPRPLLIRVPRNAPEAQDLLDAGVITHAQIRRWKIRNSRAKVIEAYKRGLLNKRKALRALKLLREKEEGIIDAVDPVVLLPDELLDTICEAIVRLLGV